MTDAPPADLAESRRSTLAALAEQALAGSEDAFAAIYDRLVGGTRRFFAKRLRSAEDPELVEELTQRVWVESWRALHERRYQPQRAALSTFVYAIAQHVLFRHWRQLGRAPMGGDLWTTLAAGSDRALQTEDSTDLTLDLAASIEALKECVATAQRSWGQVASDALESGAEGGAPPPSRAPKGDPQSWSTLLEGMLRGDSERELAKTLDLAPSSVHERKNKIVGLLRRCMRQKGFRFDGS